MPTQVSADMLRIIGLVLDMTPEQRSGFWLHDLDGPARKQLLVAARHELGTPFGLWRDDPVGFIEDALGETLWERQRVVARSVQDNTRTAVPSCADAGKSHLASRLVAWWVMVWPVGTAKVVTTATKDRQVVKELWPHIRFVHSQHDLPGTCLTKDWQLGDLDTPVAYGYSPADTDETAFSGIHAHNMLVVVDEAGGISPILGRSLEGMMTGEGGKARMLLIGNPPFDETATPWFEERCERPSYNVVPIPAATTPNFTGAETPPCQVHPDLPPHPISDHLIGPRWVKEVADDYGTDDAYYIARVEARFPKNLASKVIPRSFVDAAVANDEPEQSTWVRLGVDPAADGGDEFVIARADGMVGRIVHAERPTTDPEMVFHLAGKVLEQIEAAEVVRRQFGEERPVRVKVDSGGLGLGVYNALVAWGSEGRHQAEVVEVSAGESPATVESADRYANKRAEMWYTGRALCEITEERPYPAWRLDVDDSVARQLSTPNKKWHTSGRRLVESKGEMRKRGVKSPDRADALLMAFYEPAPPVDASFSFFSGPMPQAPTR
jgi:hypothetical protein